MLIWLGLAALVGVLVGVWLERFRSGRGKASAGNGSELTDNRATDDTRFAEAVRSLPLGLVLASEHGEVVYRNAFAIALEAGPRVSRALVKGQVNDLLTAARGGDSVITELGLFGPPRRRLRFWGRPVLDGGSPAGAVVIISDVTEEHRIDQVRRDFVANVSHELKTPVGAMSILAEALNTAGNQETVDRLAGRIQIAALRLGETVDDLLTLSTIEAGEQVEFEDVNIGELLASALDHCRPEALGRAVELQRCEIAETLSIPGDRVQLSSALTNLITNAIKYSDAGGRVVVDVQSDPSWLDIRVIDTGVGIPESDHDRIFERFYRVDAARSRKSGGTGLGLSIVKHVAINHGGEVLVSSEEGRGSTFTLRLPKQDRSQ